MKGIMIKVKICGLTRNKDALWANELMPDFIGFVFALSKREVTIKKAAEIVSLLHPSIKKVGVFVNPTLDLIKDAIENAGLDIIQLHSGDIDEIIKLDINVWQVARVKDKASIDDIMIKGDALLLDCYSEKGYGGLNETFDWKLAVDLCADVKIVLAGGLNADNVGDAIDIVKPWAVDISSGVETYGIKDPVKIEEFIRRTRQHG